MQEKEKEGRKEDGKRKEKKTREEAIEGRDGPWNGAGNGFVFWIVED